ncbi:MAG: hypothetical protein ABL974_23790 [Prosthecobacter sp.]
MLLPYTNAASPIDPKINDPKKAASEGIRKTVALILALQLGKTRLARIYFD